MYRALNVREFNLFSVSSSMRLVKCSSTNVAASKSNSPVSDKNVKPFSEIPKIPALPFIGTTWTLLPLIGKYDFRKLHKASELKYKQYGKIVREDLTKHNKLVHIFEPEDFEKVFRNEGISPVRQPAQSFVKVISERKDIFRHPGLFNSNGDEWYNLRSRVQGHMMKPRTTINFLKVMDEVATDFIERMLLVRDHQSLEINNYKDELNKFSLESIGLVALDTRIGCFDTKLKEDSEIMRYVRAVSGMFDMLYELEFKAPFWRVYPTPLYKKFASAVYFCTEVAQKHLGQARVRLEKNKDTNRELSLLELILAENLDPRDVNIVVNDMFLAGVDATSNSSAFFLYNMAKHPEEQEKLYAEIKRLLPKPNSPITEEVLSESRYVKACLKESMRLTPIGVGTIRKLVKDTVLAGYNVPTGSQVFMHFMVASRNEKYFDDPLVFRPERWLRDNPKSKEINPFSSLPFGFGPRGCIGRRLAEQEMHTLFIRIFERFRVEYNHGEMDMRTKMFNEPDKPLRFAFQDRV